jgi:DnaJ domain
MNPYQVLGVSPHSSLTQIKSAYRHAAAHHHPDRGGSHEMMVAINTAYEQLTQHFAATNPTTDRSAPPAISLSDWYVLYNQLLELATQRRYKRGWITYQLIELQPPLEIWQLHGQLMGYKPGFAHYHWDKQ